MRIALQGIQYGFHILKITDLTAEVDIPFDVIRDKCLILILEQRCKQTQVFYLFRLQTVLFHETGQVTVRVKDVAVLVRDVKPAVAQSLEQRQRLLR